MWSFTDQKSSLSNRSGWLITVQTYREGQIKMIRTLIFHSSQLVICLCLTKRFAQEPNFHLKAIRFSLRWIMNCPLFAPKELANTAFIRKRTSLSLESLQRSRSVVARDITTQLTFFSAFQSLNLDSAPTFMFQTFYYCTSFYACI